VEKDGKHTLSNAIVEAVIITATVAIEAAVDITIAAPIAP
jgi:hypothetical protein